MSKKRFENYDNIKNNSSFSFFLRWMKERATKKKDLSKKIEQHITKEVDRIKHNNKDMSITWIGHSTFLIQISGLNILTDPVWANWMGVQKRLTQPGITISDLPDIDIVLISHGHYDHLDFPTIKKIKGDITFYVPQGLKKLFVKKGYSKVIEANWWDSFKHSDIDISFVPAQHWTKRTMVDTNTSHWGGWIIENAESKNSIYFVGDTGYFRGFKDIAERFELDIVLMPIGAYEPEYFMKVSHINPEDAIKAFLELKGKTFIPMHYGTYRLADDTGPEALDRMFKEWERLDLDKNNLKVLFLGETFWVNI